MNLTNSVEGQKFLGRLVIFICEIHSKECLKEIITLVSKVPIDDAELFEEVVVSSLKFKDDPFACLDILVKHNCLDIN